MSSTPIPSSTIVIARDKQLGTGIEIFMVVRHHQIDFASGALVFPGGKVSESDYDSDLRKQAIPPFELDDTQFPLMVAAIREAFEESGILFARSVGGDSLVTNGTVEKLEPYRSQLEKNQCSMAEFIRQEGLSLAMDELHHFAHWVTPDMMPKRFDTHFYLARAPEGHLGSHDGHESVDSTWISPQQALSDADEGKLKVIFPTRMNLMRLAKYSSVEEAITATRLQKTVKVMPWTEQKEAGAMLCIPEDAGYEITEVPMDVVMRS
ncbi:MAG: NUDIX hydrolase [Pseudomonadales bacterium]|nr:NUDIX hydrolase [Pseudomonadales bacterium]